MSLYHQCSQAVSDLIANPPDDLPFTNVFTEIDVVNRTQSLGSDWGNDPTRFRAAMRTANAVVGTKYRERKLCRYGPVTLPDGNLDYTRLASKIVYADAELGPAKLETPNGNFRKMMIEDDPITKQGRKFSSNRDDSKKWDEQDVVVRKEVSKDKADLTAAHKRIHELQEELERARTQAINNSSGVSREEFDALTELMVEFDGRLQTLEDREEARERVYQRGAA